jgi:hypothetical protein
MYIIGATYLLSPSLCLHLSSYTAVDRRGLNRATRQQPRRNKISHRLTLPSFDMVGSSTVCTYTLSCGRYVMVNLDVTVMMLVESVDGHTSTKREVKHTPRYRSTRDTTIAIMMHQVAVRDERHVQLDIYKYGVNSYG